MLRIQKMKKAMKMPETTVKALAKNGGISKNTCTTTMDQESYCAAVVPSAPASADSQPPAKPHAILTMGTAIAVVCIMRCELRRYGR